MVKSDGISTDTCYRLCINCIEMIQLTQHNQSLKDLILSIEETLLNPSVDLDSFDIVLREYLSIDEMREVGCFFTGQALAHKLVASLPNPILSDSIVLDPACGAGNLLIECSRRLPVCDTLSVTLANWGKVLWGYDLYPSFIDAAKLRLIIEAMTRGAQRDCGIDKAFELLPNICVKDALDIHVQDLDKVTHIVINPPFTICESPKINFWKRGKVNSAGVFVDKYVRNLPDGCSLGFILPDVLRSGSRYGLFRDFLDSNIHGAHSIWGRFNNKTDVDVFIVSGILKRNNESKDLWKDEARDYIPLSQMFDVRVGPLVAYRDPEVGIEYPYFHAKNSFSWHVLTEATEFRKFSGTVIKPPFVIIKRTSSPNDRYRAQCAVINMNEYIAVENHMIIASPKSGKVEDCIALLNILKSQETNDFLNNRIRLRHLTVSAIKDIPIK